MNFSHKIKTIIEREGNCIRDVHCTLNGILCFLFFTMLLDLISYRSWWNILNGSLKSKSRWLFFVYKNVFSLALLYSYKSKTILNFILLRFSIVQMLPIRSMLYNSSSSILKSIDGRKRLIKVWFFAFYYPLIHTAFTLNY